MKKTFQRLLSVMLCLLLLLSIAVLPAFAGGVIGDLHTEVSAMNELTASQMVNQYFEQRQAYLNGSSTAIEVVNSGMLADETKHKVYLQERNITIQDSTIVDISTICWDDTAQVIATESATFSINGEVVLEEIKHEITLYCNSDKCILLQSDAYYETTTGFSSASYLSPEAIAQAEINAALGGSGACIRYVAHNEVGAAGSSEDASGNTKYHTWYDAATGYPEYGGAWCAIFVSWCAAHANISSSTVCYVSYVPAMRDFFANRGQYYNWTSEQNKKNNGQAYTAISAGDIIFMNNTAASPAHVGIVYAVSGNVIWIVDGNHQNRVCYRTVPDTNTAIVGFAKPSYFNSSHVQSPVWTYDDSSHWHACTNCNLGQFSKDFHVREKTDMGWAPCTVCGYDGPLLVK